MPNKRQPKRFRVKEEARAYLEALAENPEIDWLNPEDLPPLDARAAVWSSRASCAFVRRLCERQHGKGAFCDAVYHDCLKGGG